MGSSAETSVFIFSYGTLQDRQIQQELYGRTLSGHQDSLSSYILSTINLPENSLEQNTYFIAEYTGNPNDSIGGFCYEITSAELLITDAYEGAAYTRKSVRLNSGRACLVCIKA